ncbi:MAG: hypothetical protein PVSMB4_06700 [Ktedonobacterales bacterium]
MRKAKESLARQQARRDLECQHLRTVLDMLPVGVFIADADGRFLEANAAARSIWGEDVPLVTELSAYDAYRGWWPDTGKEVEAAEWPLARAVAKGETCIGEEIEIQAVDGTRKTILDSAVPLRDATGAIVGGVNVNVDITERKRAEEQIRRLNAELEQRVQARTAELEAANQQKDQILTRERAARDEAEAARSFLATILDQVPAVICVLEGPDHVCRLLNPHGARVLQSVHIDPMGRRIQDSLPGLREQGYLAVLDQVYRAGKAVSLPGTHYRFLTPAGTATDTWWDVVFVPWQQPDGTITGVVALGQEVSDRVRAQAERDRLARQKDEFLSVASHELRTPLTSLKGRVQLARRRLQRAGLAEESYLAWMERAIARMERLVNDLVDISRIQSGKLDLQSERFDLSVLCRHIAEEQAENAERPVTVEVPDTPIEAEGDADRIGQVLANLLSNALKYSPAYRPVVLTLQSGRGEALIRVRDEGPGIPADALPHLFERFYRVPGIEVQSGTGVGLGLGLYICREIMERHGGRIWAESSVGHGSTFYVALPLVP